MEKKKKTNWFFRIVVLLFILYLSLSIAMETGYYESKLNEKTMLTEEGIKQFEQDVREGKNVDINNYITEKNRDFSNGATKTGVFLSSIVQDFMSKGITGMADLFKKLFIGYFDKRRKLSGGFGESGYFCV